MDIIEITGDELRALLAYLSCGGIAMLRVAVDEDGAKFKVNSGVWSPPLGSRA